MSAEISAMFSEIEEIELMDDEECTYRPLAQAMHEWGKFAAGGPRRHAEAAAQYLELLASELRWIAKGNTEVRAHQGKEQ